MKFSTDKFLQILRFKLTDKFLQVFTDSNKKILKINTAKILQFFTDSIDWIKKHSYFFGSNDEELLDEEKILIL